MKSMGKKIADKKQTDSSTGAWKRLEIGNSVLTGSWGLKQY